MEQGMFRLKIWEVVLLVVVIGVLITSVAAQNTQAALSEKVVRLHVLANSDTEEDQNLKLMVRDAILEHTEQLLKSTESRKEAEALLRGQLLELEQVASETICIAGFEYPVSVELTETAFPTKEYDGFSLPAGEYLSLRVLIGNALGQNWWCVLFPPLCFTDSNAQATEGEASAAPSGKYTTDAPKQKIVIKWRGKELYEKWMA